jgi:uncharacterized protein YndB with AHSA1/START domain
MTARSVTHGTFVIERSYDASPHRLFAAWSDPKAKAQWFAGPDDWQPSDHRTDFRVGGQEHVSGASPDGGPGVLLRPSTGATRRSSVRKAPESCSRISARRSVSDA